MWVNFECFVSFWDEHGNLCAFRKFCIDLDAADSPAPV